MKTSYKILFIGSGFIVFCLVAAMINYYGYKGNLHLMIGAPLFVYFVFAIVNYKK